jgi:phosphatidylserine/phosphatidylglycerophosphate/cardiolipin synthase-like enzyme
MNKMKNKVLSGIEIYPKIISELKKSEKEILVVSNWFIDENLFEILLKKQEQGVKVKLIIEDDEVNEKFSLFDLNQAGGEIYKIKKENFGLMHKRYCIVDEKIAIFPLAIWSPYVLVQNYESLIVTGHFKTIQNFTTHFYKIKSSSSRLTNEKAEKTIICHIKNWVLKFFRIKRKDAGTQKVTGFQGETISKKEIKFKMIDTSNILKDESDYFFLNRN